MKGEEELENMRSLACALHGVYFGTFQALKKERNFFDVHEVAIKGVNNTVESYFKHFGQKDVADLLIELESRGGFISVNKFFLTGAKREIRAWNEGFRKLLEKKSEGKIFRRNGSR